MDGAKFLIDVGAAASALIKDKVFQQVSEFRTIMERALVGPLFGSVRRGTVFVLA